jgi:hypothetical protein
LRLVEFERSEHVISIRATNMTSRSIAFWAVLIAIMLSPAVAFANMGTPLMIASWLHLFVGNAVIGLGEGLLLAFMFRKNAGLCIAVMIAANYFSAWVGAEVLEWLRMSTALDLDLYNAWLWLWIMVVISYVLTILLEWPFVALCLRKTEGWFRKSVRGSLIVQTVSYVAIFGWYWSASDKAIYTDLTIVQSSEMSLPEKTIVYYISASDNDVYAMNLGQGTTRKVGELKSIGTAKRLSAKESKETPGHWDLVASNEIDTRSEGVTKTVVADFSRAVARPRDPKYALDVLRFAAEKPTDWEFNVESWHGLYGTNSKDGRELSVSLETPFVTWYSHFATQLPGGQVIVQLGRNQICILDAAEGKIAIIAKGRSPVVGIESNSAK